MGMHSVRAANTEELVRALERAQATPGPDPIEALVLPSLASLKLKMLPRILGHPLVLRAGNFIAN